MKAMVNPRRFREVIDYVAVGVAVITVDSGGVTHAAPAAGVSFVQAELPMIVVTLDRSAPVCQAVCIERRFALSVLACDQADVLGEVLAADTTSTTIARPAGGYGDDLPFVEGAAAHLDCRVVNWMGAFSHRVILAELQAAETFDRGALVCFRGELTTL
jgi:flavin reductase (DIM6/NTAB) family NADH-FMN oxidoreductase RutF